MKPSKLKLVGFALLIATAAIEMVTKVVDEKKQQEEIEKAVQKELDRRAEKES